MYGKFRGYWRGFDCYLRFFYNTGLCFHFWPVDIGTSILHLVGIKYGSEYKNDK